MFAMKIGENGQVTSAMYLAIEVNFVFEGKELVIFNKLLKEKKKFIFNHWNYPGCESIEFYPCAWLSFSPMRLMTTYLF